MKTSKFYVMIALITIIIASCSKSNDTTTVVTPPPPVSNPISPGNISGFVKGTLTTGNTYTITSDLTIKLGDTAAQPRNGCKRNSQINVRVYCH
jgi:hypothetical protein